VFLGQPERFTEDLPEDVSRTNGKTALTWLHTAGVQRDYVNFMPV